MADVMHLILSVMVTILELLGILFVFFCMVSAAAFAYILYDSPNLEDLEEWEE